MRVTNGMILSTVTSNLFRSQRNYLSIQTQASSGRRLNKPSDDPLGVTKDLGFRSILISIDQFKKNIDHAKSWLTFSDQALGNINELVSSAKELMVQMGNDTYDQNARQSAAHDIDEIMSQILDAANTQYQGSYIFSGSKTDRPPIQLSAIGAVYQGDDVNVTLETEPSSYLRQNSKANDFLTRSLRTLGDGADINPGIQPNLWLNYLHRGKGADLGAGLFKVRTISGEYTIDVSAAQNVQDVLDALNGAGIPNFSASINEAGTGFILEDTTTHQITADTPLALLNMGQGVEQSPGLIHFSDGGAVSVDVDISAAATVGDVVDSINNQLSAAGVAGVTASIDPDHNRLIITDSNASGMNLTISEASDGAHTAANLGILGQVQGSLTGEDIKPFHIQVTENAAGQNTAQTLGILEGTEFGVIDGDDLDPDLAYFSNLSSLFGGRDTPMGKIRIVCGNDFRDIDLAPLANDPTATVTDLIKLINASGMPIEARINDQHSGIAIVSKAQDRSLMIYEADDGHTARDLGIFGSPDLLGNFIIAKRALERNDTAEIGLTMTTFELGLDRVLVERSDVGARVNRAQTANARLESFEFQVTNRLSNIEDADMTKVITDLAAAEAVYQSALAAAARMIQPSLINFLQ